MLQRSWYEEHQRRLPHRRPPWYTASVIAHCLMLSSVEYLIEHQFAVSVYVCFKSVRNVQPSLVTVTSLRNELNEYLIFLYKIFQFSLI